MVSLGEAENGLLQKVGRLGACVMLNHGGRRQVRPNVSSGSPKFKTKGSLQEEERK